ncbi:hypothetical protein H0H87_000129 [Tephrocybe sp. NHM501043]|nr:hypothetical protein H0H87_000129 [Tephrocybe sp. NHM501043]
MAAKIYYDADADLSLLNDKKIVFLGFGNQGAAQAQNLRDSGIPNDSILVANRDDSYAADAKSKGFHVEHDFAKAAAVADVLFLLIPDQVQPRVFNQQVAPSLKGTATIVIASGYNVFYKLLKFQGTQDVVMVAPREAFSVLKEAGCSDEALCYEMWMSKEPAEIFERAAEDGFIHQLKHHSSVSQFGQLSGALALDGKEAREHFKHVLYNQVLNGKFCEEFSKIEDDLEKEGPENPLNELYRRSEESELGQAEKRVRARLAGLLA